MNTMSKLTEIRITLYSFLSLLIAGNANAQLVTDTIGNTIVQIDVAVDTSHFEGGYTSGPWDLYWGPDQTLWFTNKRSLQSWDPATNQVRDMLTLSSGYLMSVVAHSDFQNNPYVYVALDTGIYYGQSTRIEVYRYTYDPVNDSLVAPLFLLSWYHPGEHSGGRLLFGADEKLYITTAEYWASADTLFSNSGKVLRVNPDGTVPPDNPRADFTWSYGHRNPQGIVQVPNGSIFVSEYGQVWDELNLIERNEYYGWFIFDGNQCMQHPDTCLAYQPLITFPLDAGWNPPSGIDYYSHAAIPELNGVVEAVTGNNQGIIVYGFNADFDSVLSKNYYLTFEYGRVRDVCASPDGKLYFIARDRSKQEIRVIYNPLFTGISDFAAEPPGMTLFPNPCRSNVHVNAGYAAGEVSILDFSGREMIRKSFSEPKFTISTGSLLPGLYVVHLRAVDGVTYCKKLLVE